MWAGFRQHLPAARHWLGLMRIGDYAVLCVGLVIVVVSARSLWMGDRASRVIVRAAGEQVARIDLDRAQHLRVAGPLGETLIEVELGRVRVAADPGPRQYCVQQGWLSQIGAVAICAPNQVSLQLEGHRASYDTLSY